MEGPRTGGKLFRGFSFLKRDHFRIERASLNAKEAQHRRPFGNLDLRFRVLATGSAPTSDAPPVTAERLAHEEAPVRAVRGFFFVHSSDTLSWCSRSALGQITAPPKDNSQTWKGRRQRGRRLFIFLELRSLQRIAFMDFMRHQTEGEFV